MGRFRTTSSIVLCALLGCGVPSKAGPGGSLWVKQVGTVDWDYSQDIAVDAAGSAIVVGATGGPLAGAFRGGYYDAWVMKFNSAGSRIWKAQIGSDGLDEAKGVAVNPSGSFVIAGHTNGNLGSTSKGYSDAWVARYGKGNQRHWITQFGSADIDIVWGAAIDSAGNAYVVGQTYGDLGGVPQGDADVWVSKLSRSGKVLWTRHLGSDRYDAAFGVAVDGSGNVFIAGHTLGDIAPPNTCGNWNWDAWIAKYTPTGKRAWVREFCAKPYSEDHAWSIGVDHDGNVFACGSTTAAIAGKHYGDHDYWLAKYSNAGKRQWIRQYGTTEDDACYGLSVDSGGDIALTGDTNGRVAGSGAAILDAWVAKYSNAGTRRWIRQLGTSAYESSWGVSADGLGNVYISGSTEGNLAATNSGEQDAFVAKFAAD